MQLAVHLLVGLLLKLLQISLGFQLLCTQAVDLFLLLFQLLSGLVQLRKDIFKAGLFRRDIAFCRFDDFLRQSQPLADGKCVGFAGNSNQQTVGRLEGFHIELAACVADARRLQSIFLDFRIMGGRTHLGAVHGKALHDGDCQSSAFDRVGTRTQFVDQHQAVRIGFLDDGNDVGHVRREGGQALLDALFVTDVHQHLLVHRNAAVFCDRQHQTAHRHQGQQTHCF